MSSSTSSDRYDSKGREKVKCEVCGGWYHRLEVHLKKKHDKSVEEYRALYPGKPTISEAARKFASRGAKKRKTSKGAGAKERIKKKVRIKKKDPVAEAKAAHAKEAADPDLLRVGVARLRVRRDLTAQDAFHVPAHDPHFEIGPVEKERMEYIMLGIQANENVMIVGPTGCGKSAIVQQLAAAANQPLRRINLHGDVRAADFVGDKTVDVDPKTSQAVVTWQDGLLTEAMRNGHWLLIDELDAGPAHILFVIQAVLEKGMTLVLPGNGGEVVKAHPNFRIIATANTLGRGDDSGMYTGTNLLNEAFLDRFGIVIKASYPRKATETSILVDRTGIATEIAEKMVNLAIDVRKAAEMETVYCTLSTRRLIAWADKAVRLGDVKRASNITISNRLAEEDAKFITGLVQRYFG